MAFGSGGTVFYKISCFAFQSLLVQVVETIDVLFFILGIFLGVAWVWEWFVLGKWKVVRSVGVTCSFAIFYNSFAPIRFIIVPTQLEQSVACLLVPLLHTRQVAVALHRHLLLF